LAKLVAAEPGGAEHLAQRIHGDKADWSDVEARLEDVQHQSACCTLRSMRTVVGVAEARAQLSDIVAQAANGQVTVIERYGRPTAAVIPFDALESLPDSDVPTESKPSARHRQAQLLDALARLQEAVEAQTPQDADLIYEALNGAYETSRGRRLER
jgi:prevent-host-death family protein